MNNEKQLLLSLTDLISLLNRFKWVMLFFGITCALCAFFCLLFKPTLFTAKGIFKNHTAENGSNLSSAKSLLSQVDAYLPKDEPRTFLVSYPVLEKVVLELNLQAMVTGQKKANRAQEAWYTLKTALALQRLKKQKPPSQILTADVLVSDSLIIPDPVIKLSCLNVHFFGETSQSLLIHWLSADTFKVLSKKKECIGQGQLGLPFDWEHGTFTLIGNGTKGKTHGLHFIPLEQAVLSLQKSILVAKDKDNLSLLHISYTHRNRYLATNIVNAVMEQFEEYLQAEGKKKIIKQLDYLNARYDHNTDFLDRALQQHQLYLESHLDQGSIISLEKELEFMTTKQAASRNKMLSLRMEIEALCHHDQDSFEKLIIDLASIRHLEPLQTLSVEGARHLIQNRQHDLDLLYFNREKYDYCLAKLSKEEFDSSSLSQMLNDEIPRALFEKIETFHHRLIDQTSWTAKERELLQGELAKEKTFICQHLVHLKEGLDLQESLLKERLEKLKTNLVYLLIDQYEQEKKTLAILAQEAETFPQKWLNQQKIELSTKLHHELIFSIAKMIEAKNLGYHIDERLASTFKRSSPPILPDQPHLFIKSILLGIVAAGLFLLSLVFYLMWQGPTASLQNLKSQGRKVIAQPDNPALLGLELIDYGTLILWSSRSIPQFLSSLIQWLTRKGEKVFVIDLSSRSLPSFMAYEERSSYLASHRFQMRLQEYRKSYDRIFILSNASIESAEIKRLISLVDGILFGVTEEKLDQISQLPQNTLFYSSTSKANEAFSLQTIVPKLEGLLETATKI